MNQPTPYEIFKELFVELHTSGIWKDGKYISDAIPKISPEIILTNYEVQKERPNFDLETFFNTYFEPSESKAKDFNSNVQKPVEHHIERLWEVLQRKADEHVEGSSLIPLPYSYIVPGGRFNEIYYWDSYFTMLGLQVSGEIRLIENMIDNFSWLIGQFGFIPNGNRTYFLSRSQPPFYALMVQLLAEEKGGIWEKYLPYLSKEYHFWMNGVSDITNKANAFEHVVLMEQDKWLNRYYDRVPEPRQEMYGDDVITQKESKRDAGQFYLHIRAACESGWDFSSRWFSKKGGLTSINALNILPVDLNCLLYNMECVLSEANRMVGDSHLAHQYEEKAEERLKLIQQYCWDEKSGFYYDFDFVKNKRTEVKSLAGMFPLFFRIATQQQAERCADVIQDDFLKDGGLITTTRNTGQQWDAPNGWAPLQWIAIQGLRNYGLNDLAEDIKNRWTALNIKVFKQTGKLLEKYNVEDMNLLSGGGEYPVQDGFGWTNGVLLKLLSEK